MSSLPGGKLRGKLPFQGWGVIGLLSCAQHYFVNTKTQRHEAMKNRIPTVSSCLCVFASSCSVLTASIFNSTCRSRHSGGTDKTDSCLNIVAKIARGNKDMTVMISASVTFRVAGSLQFIDFNISSKNVYTATVFITMVNLFLSAWNTLLLTDWPFFSI